MYYVALDQSLANTGWCSAKFVENKLTIRFGIIKTDSKWKLYDRLLYIEQQLTELIKVYKPEQLFTEVVFNLSLGKKTKSQTDLTRVETIVHRKCHELGLPVLVVPSSPKHPESWRKFLELPKGKQASKNYLNEKFQGLKLNEHSADAIAILFAGLRNIGLIDRIEELTTIEFTSE